MTLSESIKQLGRPIAFYPWIAKLIGIKQGLLICQLLYWTGKEKNERGNGWIYKSVEELEDETCIPERTCLRIRDELVEKGLLEYDHQREKHRIWLRVNCEALDKMADVAPAKMAVGHVKMADATRQNGRSFNTETTTESTADIAPQAGAICHTCGLAGVHHCKGQPRKYREAGDRYRNERKSYVQNEPKRSKGEERAERTRKALAFLDDPKKVFELMQPAVPSRNKR